jgi:hypothetical protein
MKVEELLRAHMAEAQYQAHLENLKLKERVHEMMELIYQSLPIIIEVLNSL